MTHLSSAFRHFYRFAVLHKPNVGGVPEFTGNAATVLISASQIKPSTTSAPHDDYSLIRIHWSKERGGDQEEGVRLAIRYIGDSQCVNSMARRALEREMVPCPDYHLPTGTTKRTGGTHRLKRQRALEMLRTTTARKRARPMSRTLLGGHDAASANLPFNRMWQLSRHLAFDYGKRCRSLLTPEQDGNEPT